MHSHRLLKYIFLSLLIGCLGIIGCSSGTKTHQAELENLVPEEEDQEKIAVEILEIIQEAEKHYKAGCEYYDEQHWILAHQEFDTALETLLDADVDAETHYMLSQTYDRLFYRIHKLELAQQSLRGLPENEIPQIAESTEELEASLVYTHPEFFEEEQVQEQPERLNIFEYDPAEVLGEILIDDSDEEIMRYVKEFSRDRSQYRKGLERAVYYLPMILQIFEEQQIPPELAFIPLIESNFRIDAVSPAGAVGSVSYTHLRAHET